MNAKCNDCIYSRTVNFAEGRDLMKACVYILLRYEKRPCPSGEQCTVFERRHGRAAFSLR